MVVVYLIVETYTKLKRTKISETVAYYIMNKRDANSYLTQLGDANNSDHDCKYSKGRLVLLTSIRSQA